jgi:hypothetical protein
MYYYKLFNVVYEEKKLIKTQFLLMKLYELTLKLFICINYFHK